jgi:hypothetical protein
MHSEKDVMQHCPFCARAALWLEIHQAIRDFLRGLVDGERLHLLHGAI